jgi:hypothetical protein
MNTLVPKQKDQWAKCKCEPHHYSPICNPSNPQPNLNHHGRKPLFDIKDVDLLDVGRTHPRVVPLGSTSRNG